MKSIPIFAAERIRLVRPLTLLIALVIAVALLVALFPGRQRLITLAEQRHTDALSIAYLHLLLRINPGEKGLRWALAHNFAALGKWEQARAALGPLLNQAGEEGRQARLVVLELDFSSANALPVESQERGRILATLPGQIEILSAEALRWPALARLAQISLAVNRPDLAAPLYRRLAALDAGKRQTWLELGARAYLASGTPATAGRVFQEAAARDQTGGASRRHILSALDAYVTGKAGKEALELAQAAAPEMANNHEFMQQVVAIALLRNDICGVQQLGRRMVALAPEKPAILARQVEVELAAEDLPAALALALHVVRLDPASSESRTRLALIAEAAGAQDIALEQWRWLAHRDPCSEAMENALRLAAARKDDALWLELAAHLVTARQLKPQEIAVLSALQIRNKQSPQLIGFLQRYVERYPAPREIWEALARTQEQLGDLAGAVATWQLISPHLVSATESARRQAELLVFGGKPDDSLAALRAARSNAKSSDSEYWRMYGDFAWDRAQKQEALRAYRTVWRSGSSDVCVAERLIMLYQTSGKPRLAIATGVEAYRRRQESYWLLIAMDTALRASRWNDLRSMAELAQRAESKFANSEMYWQMQAQLTIHDQLEDSADPPINDQLSLDVRLDVADAKSQGLAERQSRF